MNRSLYCRKCGEETIKRGLHPEDKKMGWKWRICYVSATVVPKDHGMTMITGDKAEDVFQGKGQRQFVPMTDLQCDQCNEPITGEIAVARTMWILRGEDEPRLWENDYGHILPAEAVAVADALEGGKQHGKP